MGNMLELIIVSFVYIPDQGYDYQFEHVTHIEVI